MRTCIATMLRIFSFQLKPNVRLFVKMLKQRLKKQLGLRLASEDTLKTVRFIKEMHDKNKNKEAVAEMLFRIEHQTEHKEFFIELLRKVYNEVIDQMYIYFESPEFVNDPVEWESVFSNIFESVMDSKAELFAQHASEKYGLDELSEPEFWDKVTKEIEEMTQT